MSTRYWGFRLFAAGAEGRWFHGLAHENLFRELEEGRLRIGWGTSTEQELRYQEANGWPDDKMWGHHEVYRRAKKGDILFVPRLPSWEEVSVVRAANNFWTGYQYDAGCTYGDGTTTWTDYRHCFPVEYLGKRRRDYCPDGADIRRAISLPPRAWPIREKYHDRLAKWLRAIGVRAQTYPTV